MSELVRMLQRGSLASATLATLSRTQHHHNQPHNQPRPKFMEDCK
jgi:hypothetical protein